jgi:hypothetical protein
MPVSRRCARSISLRSERMVLYHYESEQAGESIERSGFAIAHRGERFVLNRSQQPSPGAKTLQVEIPNCLHNDEQEGRGATERQ